VLAYHIREGTYGNIRLDGLNVLAVSQFEGNIWAEEARLTLGLYADLGRRHRQHPPVPPLGGPMAQPIIALADCHNFYVSCERVFQPRLEALSS
jgi:Protein of unknown function (DUF1326)